MTNIILHITHTDISRDARILKQIEDIENNFPRLKVLGIGIKKKKKGSQNKKSSFEKNLLNFSLITKQIFFLPKFLVGFLVYLEFLARVLLQLNKKRRPLVIHCHDHVLLPISFFIKILFGSKLIYDAHELESLDEINQIRFSQRSKITFFLERIIWKKIDLFITVSSSILNWYHKKLGYKKNSIVVLNSPKIMKKKSFKKESLRQKLKISKNRLIFVYVGSFQYGRGIDIMLKAFSEPKINSNLVFIGYGKLESKIKEHSKKYKNIHILKSVPHNELTQFITSANIGLCLIEKKSLSQYYCLPNKFFEFAFANLHILASNFPDMKKLIQKYTLGSYIAPTYEQLIKKIKYFETNLNSVKIKKKRLIELEWSFQSKKLIESYKKIISI